MLPPATYHIVVTLNYEYIWTLLKKSQFTIVDRFRISRNKNNIGLLLSLRLPKLFSEIEGKMPRQKAIAKPFFKSTSVSTCKSAFFTACAEKLLGFCNSPVKVQNTHAAVPCTQQGFTRGSMCIA